MDQFKSKKIAIIGLSIEGIASAQYLSAKNLDITVCDQRNEQKFEKNFLHKLRQRGVKTKLGRSYLSNLVSYDFIVRTPGFPLWNEKLQDAIKNGVIVTSQTQLFFELCKGKIIGVTGTKGKGTTSTLIYAILKDAGKKVFLGGNIGTPPFSFLDQTTKDSWVVLELSSFQLENLTISPHISVILNITSDHLYSASWESPNYHLSHGQYLQAKTNIVRFQKESDFTILNRDYERSNNLTKYTPADIWLFSIKQPVSKGAFIKKNTIFLSNQTNTFSVCQTSDIQLRGVHNLENVLAGVTASYLAGVNVGRMRATIRSFKALEHRLEYVAIRSNVQFYNDSFSTTPETTIAAIKSFTEPIILICGGSEKRSDYTKLGKEIAKSKHIKNVILIGATAKKIKKAILSSSSSISALKNKHIAGPKTMDEIVKLAYKLSAMGDVVLLSPACASFDMFKNYKERGMLFKSAVFSLPDNK